MWFVRRYVTTAVTLCLVVAATGSCQSPNRRAPRPQVKYPLNSNALPNKDVPKGKLEGPFLFHSKIIANTVRKYWIYVPAQYDAKKAACVLVFQDGARAINPDGVLRVPQVLENLIAKKQIPVTIGVFITPGQRGDEFPDSIGTGNPNNRDREYDVLDDSYARFLIEELLPEVAKKYNLTDDPAGRAIGGASSGAICAFTVAWHRPDQFRNVVSMIGSYTNIHGGHVYPDLVRENEKKPIRIFLQDGVNDLRNPNDPNRDWYLQNQKMVAALKEKGYDVAHVFGEGGHSDDHGGAILSQMLRWIWRDHPDVTPSDDDLVAQAAAIRPEKEELFPGFDANAKIDPTGVYTWEVRFRDVTIKNALTLAMKDGKITGTYQTQRGDSEPSVVDVSEAVMEGNKLSFDVTRNFRDRDFTSTYQGVVTDDGIRGWRMMNFGGRTRDTRWNAKRKRPEGLLRKVNDAESWQFELNGSGKGEMKIDGEAVVFHTTQLSAENWHVQAYQVGIPLSEGKTYQLKFTAKSPTNSTVLAIGIINEEDWHGIGLQEEVFLGSSYEDYSITFTASDVVPDNNRIGFVLGDSKGVVYVKAMSLFEKER